MHRSLVPVTLATLGLLALQGCSGNASDASTNSSALRPDGQPEPPATPADPTAPSPAPSPSPPGAEAALVGRFRASPTVPGGHERLLLAADGTFAARRDLSLVALCADEKACLADEAGTWSARRDAAGALELVLSPKDGVPRAMGVTTTPISLELTRGPAGAETLYRLAEGNCYEADECGSGQRCAIGVCTMACMPYEKDCCGLGKCVPATP